MGQEWTLTVLHFSYIQLPLKISWPVEHIMKQKRKQATGRAKKIMCSLSLHEMGPRCF